ncbi:Protein of unknown function (DUF1092) [Cyanidiococcus yangmingshanensis]|uniref:Uncharacterized protein n=1 Tax=Cyanidiococcus yangmingshanensis TaxID=2690220 RepID=A0A7J7IG93_9RHOD|nr:Protein of unknown function (DUF1092) [Cyanidiococcus yangmingshanensis]
MSLNFLLGVREVSCLSAGSRRRPQHLPSVGSRGPRLQPQPPRSLLRGRTLRVGGRQRFRLAALAKRDERQQDDVAVTPSSLLPLASNAVSDIWELDFYSRPVTGADGKRLWELIVCDRNGSFVHVEAFPNNMVNSRELRRALEALIAESSVKPRIVRFFRAQMRNMIQIALQNLSGVQARPSRRTYALFLTLAFRERYVYPQMPGYEGAPIGAGVRGQRVDGALSESIGSMLKGPVDLKVPKRLPDELQGDRFAFVNVPMKDVAALSATPFGELCPISLSEKSMDLELQMRAPAELVAQQGAALNIAAPDPDALVPGIVVYSRRSLPLAAWFSGTELAYITADDQRREVYLECGLDVAYLFARIQPSLETEARAFNQAKRETHGLHFLAVQRHPEDESVAGFWLLRDVEYL